MEILDLHKQEVLFDLIEQGAHESALELLKEGDNYISKEKLNNSLISACQHEHIFIIQMLVQLGANVNYIDNNRNTPLLISVKNDAMAIVKFLLTNKADVNASNSLGDSALILSINSSESTDITEILLRQPEINIHHQNQDGYTAIMKAAEVRNIKTLKLLLNEYLNLDYISTSSPLYVPADECKTHEYASNSVSDYASQWTTLGETVNCKEENVYEIAKRSGIENVFRLLQRHVITKVSLLELAMSATDIKSFCVFLDSEFLHAPESEISLDGIFLQIFQTCSGKDIIHFNENEIAMIKMLLEYGADVNITMFDYPPLFHGENPDNLRLCSTSTSQLRPLNCERLIDPLLIAAKNGCVKVLELLLSFKADVNRYNFPNSPLHIALSHGHTECAKLLVQHGANIDFKQAMKLAVDQQEPTYVRFLFEIDQNGVKKHFKRTEIQDILLTSVMKGNLEIISKVLDLGANIHGVIGSDMCPLAESKNGEVAQFLIDRDANVKGIKCVRQKKSHTPLIKVLLSRDSSENSVKEIIQVLLKNGACANECWNGITALMLAAMKEGSMSVIQILLSHGAEISERDSEGNTALIHAVRKRCFQNALFLLTFIKKGTGLLNLQNNEGLTALMCALRFRNPTIIKVLLPTSSGVNIKDRHRNTLLLHQTAISEMHADTLLKCLIQAGCDVNCQSNDGLSPLMVAAQNHLEDAMCVLLDSGAEINAVSKINVTKTALTHLPYRSHCDVDYFSCLECLLDRGASASYLAATTLHKIITTDKIHVVPRLIRCGLGPVSVSADEMFLVNQIDNVTLALIDVADITAQCSPLCTTLCVGNSALARYFVENLFLTHSDVSLLGHNKLLRQHLAQLKFKECLDILNEISTQPMSLFNLSFVAVSTAVGATPGREIRINKLPVPQIIKDKLLFKKQDVALSVLQNDITGVIMNISRI